MITENKIEIYNSIDNEIQLKVMLERDTVWHTQKQIGELFSRDYKTISKHIGNVFRERELDKV